MRAPGRFTCRMTGMTFTDGYPANLAWLFESLGLTLDKVDWHDTIPVELVRDELNAHDPNAIAVVSPSFGGRVGWVPANQARHIAPHLDAGVEYLAHLTLAIHPAHPDNPGFDLHAVRSDIHQRETNQEGNT